MKKHLLAAIISSVVLVVLSYAALLLLPLLFPKLAEEYFNPTFRAAGGTQDLLYFLHPVVLSFALAWFWNKFKDQFRGGSFIRGAELGLVYGLIAILPAMIINYSVLNISLPMALVWLVYGVIQGVIAGNIFSRIDP
jgi:predicted neutral ceramidase superfamily lipid hydrolase